MTTGIKFTIIGAGSTYTPELIEGLAAFRERLPVSEIALYDIDEKRLRTMAGFCERYGKRLGLRARLRAYTDLDEAIRGADFINTQIRVGGNRARTLDEKIPLAHGLIGQETTGAGGMMKAFRTIPVMLSIAERVAALAPDAWIVNYTNPSGLVAEALDRFSRAKSAGFCSGGILPKMWAKSALGVDHDRVRYDYSGLNHMNFIWNVRIDGRAATPEEFRAIAAENRDMDPGLTEVLGCITSPYLQYFYHPGKKLDQLRRAEASRGETVMRLEQDIYEALSDPDADTKPEALKQRGGGGYSEVAMGFLDAVANDKDTWMVVNVPNQGALDFLPANASVELPCMVNAAGIRPLVVSGLPSHVRGLIAEVKNYEQLAVEAAVEGSRVKALQAMLAHPLIRDYDVAVPLLDALLEANRPYLPQFF